MSRNFVSRGRFRSVRLWLPVVAAVLVVSGLSVAKPYLGRDRVAVDPAPAPAAARSERDAKQVLVVYCTPHGLEPDEIEIRPGRYSLMIRNRSGLDDLSFSIDRPGQDAVLEGAADAGQNVVEADVPLTPGEHFVTEASHPDWHCRITVTP